MGHKTYAHALALALIKLRGIMKKTLLTIIFLLTTSSAFAKIEQASNQHSIARGPLVLSDRLTNFDQTGYGFVDSSGDLSSTIRLTRNDAGDLLWNGNPVIDVHGLPQDRNLNLAGGIGGRVLYQSADNVTSTVNPSISTGARILSVNPVTGFLNWVNFSMATAVTGGVDNTCSKACKRLAKNDPSIVEAVCTSSREGNFAVDCATIAGGVAGINDLCSCMIFNF